MIPNLPPNLRSVSVTLHPAFALRGLRQFLPSIITTLARARHWSTQPIGPVAPRSINVEPTPDEFAEHLAKAGKGPLAIDIETPRNNPNQIDIIGAGAVEGEAVVAPGSEPFLSILGEYLRNTNVLKVGHNFDYDKDGFLANGFPTEWPCADTSHAAALLWPPIQKKKKTGKKDTMSMKWLDLASCVLRSQNGVAYWKEPDDPITQAIYASRQPTMNPWLFRRLYCGYDVVYTRALWVWLRARLQQEGLWNLYSQIVAPAGQVLWHMKARGVKVDVEKREWLKARVVEKLALLKEEILNDVNEHHRIRRERVIAALEPIERRYEATLVAGSPERCPDHRDYTGRTRRQKCDGCAKVYAAGEGFRGDLAALKKRVRDGLDVLEGIGERFTFTDDAWRHLFFDPTDAGGLGLRAIARTKKKKVPQVSGKALEELFLSNPQVPLLRKRVTYQSLQRRLKVGLAAPLDAEQRAHFAYNLARSAMGRLSSGTDDTDPDKVRKSDAGNAQNIRPEDRMVYCATSPDLAIVHFDWKQIEARNVAWHAKEYSLLDAWKRGEDTHSNNAASCFGIMPSEAKTHLVLHKGKMVPARDAGKTRVHAWNYGMGIEETARQAGITFMEAKRQRDAYFRDKQAIARYHTQTIEKAVKGLRNSFGRFLRFYGYRKRADGTIVLDERNEALAFIGQSETSDQCKAVLRPLEECAHKHGGSLLMTTHDSFDAEIPRPNVPAFIKEAKAILEKEWPEFGFLEGYGYFSCPVDVKVGDNLGEHHCHDCVSCLKTKRECDSPCLLLNLSGLREWKEAV